LTGGFEGFGCGYEAWTAWWRYKYGDSGLRRE
jgi:hypothetical protein